MDLLFESAISDVSAIPMQSSVTTRAVAFNPPDLPTASSDWSLDLELKPYHGGNVKLEWEWNGGEPSESSPSIDRYDLKTTVTSKGDVWSISTVSITMLNGSHPPELKYDVSEKASPGDGVCFVLKALSSSGSGPFTSNHVLSYCELSLLKLLVAF